MKRLSARSLAACCALAALAGAGSPSVAGSLPTLEQVVAKNAAARGGKQAWAKIHSIAFAGHIVSPAAPGRSMPFLLEQKRPARMRFEIMAPGHRSVRIFDGTHGWKMRPGNGGVPEVQAYTEEELRYVRDAQAIEGPLMAAVARGFSLTLGGAALIEGRKAYVVSYRPRKDAIHRVWVDAQTFLEVRYEREFRTARDRRARATVEFRNYTAFEGLQIPLTIEPGAAPGRPSDQLVIDRVALNPRLADNLFARPALAAARHKGVVVEARRPPIAPASPAPRR
jgi:outer membrane lipoprotein-sorting protein